VTIGILVGAVFGVWASTFVASLLCSLQPRDPGALIAAAIMLAAVATLAGWLPAQRACRIDPAETLRQN